MIAFNKPTISKKDIVRVFECLISDEIAEGNLTRQFEKEFANYLGVVDSLALQDPSHALFLIFQSIGLKEGDEVIVSALVEPCILEVLYLFKASVVLVDVREDIFLVDANQLTDKLTTNTKVIIASHTLGYAVPVLEIQEKVKATCQQKGFTQSLTFIEDCQHSLGSSLKSPTLQTPLGLVGDYAFFSFADQNIITMGQGSAIICRDKKNIKQLRQLKKGESDILTGRLNFSLTDLQAAMGLSELSLIKSFLERRCEIGDYYRNNLLSSKNRFFSVKSNSSFNYYNFVITIEQSLSICLAFFKKHRIGVNKTFLNKALYYYVQKKAVEEEKDNLDYKNELIQLFPHAATFELKCLSIPLYPALSQKNIELIGSSLNAL